jgi:hypothetical protein
MDGWMDGMDETRDLEGGREGPRHVGETGGLFFYLFFFVCVRYEKEETAFVLRPLVQFGFRFQIRARSLCFFQFFYPNHSVLYIQITSMFGWLVADGWCWFVLREEYCWLVAGLF